MTPLEFPVTISTDITAIPGVTASIGARMREHGFEEDEILDVQLAAEEAIANIIAHGYRDAPGEIVVRCTATDEMVEVGIEDSAPPFDPLSLPEPEITSCIEDRSIGGLGIYLIRKLMDGIEYRYEDGKNILVMVKWKAF